VPDSTTLWIVIFVCSAAIIIAGGLLLLVRQSNRRTEDMVRAFALDLADRYLEEHSVIDSFVEVIEQMAQAEPARRPRLEIAKAKFRDRQQFLNTRQPLLRAFGGHQMSWGQIRELFGAELPEVLREEA
jgi:hypothetical protein